jgi:hypothetical protein
MSCRTSESVPGIVRMQSGIPSPSKSCPAPLRPLFTETVQIERIPPSAPPSVDLPPVSPEPWLPAEPPLWTRFHSGFRIIVPVSRRYGVSPNLVFKWRRLVKEGTMSSLGADEPALPHSELKALMGRVGEFERLLGRKTLENEVLKEAIELRPHPDHPLCLNQRPRLSADSPTAVRHLRVRARRSADDFVGGMAGHSHTSLRGQRAVVFRSHERPVGSVRTRFGAVRVRYRHP